MGIDVGGGGSNSSRGVEWWRWECLSNCWIKGEVDVLTVGDRLGAGWRRLLCMQ